MSRAKNVQGCGMHSVRMLRWKRVSVKWIVDGSTWDDAASKITLRLIASSAGTEKR
jgi:hypothetical protein